LAAQGAERQVGTGARSARARTQPAVKPPSSLQASDRSSSQASTISTAVELVELLVRLPTKVLLFDTVSTFVTLVELLVRLPK